MNELEQQLAKVVEKSLEVAEKTGDFVIKQAPELLQEFYLWHTVMNGLGVLLLFVPIILWVIFRKVGRKEPYGYIGNCEVFGKNYRDGFAISYGIVGVFLSTLCLVSGFKSLIDFIKILVAPKIYLIEYFIN
jgi:hypothetical protein